MAIPNTNLDSIPGFDAVAESRNWREATSRQLGAMTREERLAYLNGARERYLTDRAAESSVVREESPEI